MAYLHPTKNTNVRDRCAWFSACASVSAQNKSQQRHQIMPIQNLVRPVMLQGPPKPAIGHSMIGTRPQMPQQMPMQMVPMGQQMMMPGAQYPFMVAPYIAQQGPQMVPMMYQQPGAQMPHYLSVPEPINLRESPWKRLGREILRSMLKGASHTGAAFFDSNPWRPHEIPRDNENS
jgi:hypothetical protein